MMEPKATAIIQARMTSTRLPGKVLMEVMGRPLLNYQIERLRFSKRIDNIIIATTTNKEDDPIVELAQKEGLNFYRGSEDDVLDRYYQAAKKYNVAYIMRLTADCPLIDPDICDSIVNAYFDSGVDYIRIGESFAEGLDCEIINFRALARAWQEAKSKVEREHVTLYIRNHSEVFKTMVKENETDDSRYRITVDEKEDFLVVKTILENLYKGNDNYFTVREIKSYLNTHPEVYRLNSDIIRNEGLLKSLHAESKHRAYKILIRTDASVQIGTGHVMRCLTLADELRGRGAEAIFVCREFDGNLCGYIEEKDYIVHRLPVSNEQEHNIEGNLKHAAWLGADWQTDARQVGEIIKGLENPPDWLVVDHYALDERWEGYLRPYVKKIMVIDDLADRPHDCDLLLDQNFYESLESRYDGLVPVWCEKMLGPKYALLRPEFREARKNLSKRDGHVNRIMIFFGGSDPTNETTKALEAIGMLNRPDIAVDVVVGAFNPHRKVIEQIASDLPDCTCHFKVEDMAALMAKADLAVGAGGTTVWERCVLALPGLVASVAENQGKTVSDMAESGYLLFLGQSEAVSVDSIYHALEIAIQSPWLLISFARKTQSLVDGKGVKRIAQEMLPLEITLRMATMDDCETIFGWRNAEETRRHIFNSGLISLDEHRRWFMESLENPNREILIAELCGRSAGVLRYDIDGRLAVISIYTVPGIKGYGIGIQIIRTGSKWLRRHFPDVYKIQAKVLPKNVVSKKAFVNAGYTEHHIIYEKVLLNEL